MDTLRTVTLSPYHRDYGPRFTLTIADTGRSDHRGQTVIAYRLTMREPGAKRSTVVFSGDDFAGSPMHADDSDATVASLLTFLCLQPGDTDAGYFARYTQAQLDWAAQHAEALSQAASERFGER
jgi:hypothetical protein